MTRYDAQFRIVITQTMKTRLERAAKREGIPNAEFARRALQERIDRAAAETKRQVAERKAAKAEIPGPSERHGGRKRRRRRTQPNSKGRDHRLPQERRNARKRLPPWPTTLRPARRGSTTAGATK
jgi:hypothetical protein